MGVAHITPDDGPFTADFTDSTHISPPKTLKLYQNEWDNQAKTTFTMEEVEALKKKMQSDSDKWVQKILSEKRIYERVSETTRGQEKTEGIL